jgi:hypothetical protein
VKRIFSNLFLVGKCREHPKNWPLLVLLPIILAIGEATWISVPGQPGQIVHETTIFKIIRAKWTGDVAQEIEHLLCKLKALSSNPSTAK